MTGRRDNDSARQQRNVTAGDVEPRERLDRAGIGRSVCPSRSRSTLRSSEASPDPPLANHVIQPARTIPRRLCYAEAVYHHNTSFPSQDCQVFCATGIVTLVRTCRQMADPQQGSVRLESAAGAGRPA